MAHTLELLVVLASMTSMVLRFGSGMEECTEEGYPKVINDWSRCDYEIHVVMSSEGRFLKNVRRDSQDNVYIHIPFATIERLYTHRLLNCNKHSKDEDELNITWEYQCEVAAVANRVPKLEYGITSIEPEQCQIYIFTRMEQWKRHCLIPANVKERFKSPLSYENITNSDIPKEIRTSFRDEALAYFRNNICTSLNEKLDTTPDLPLPMKVTINDAVDNSLTRFRENVMLDRAENIELKNISFSVYVSKDDHPHHTIFTGGIFEEFSRIERVGDAVATIEPHVHHIRSIFTMRQARVHFDSYYFPSGKVLFNDTISFGIRDARIELEHSGVWDSGFCIVSIWLNITRMTGITSSKHRSGESMRFSKSRTSSPTPEVEMKEVVGPYIMQHLLRYWSADYGDNIRGPCMPTSSREGRKVYSSKADYHFILSYNGL